MKPACHNRGPFLDPNAGWRPTERFAFRAHWQSAGDAVQKPIYRYRWPWFEPRCATWDGVGIGQPTPEYPTGTPYPMAHGWVDACRSCRWLPKERAHVV